MRPNPPTTESNHHTKLGMIAVEETQGKKMLVVRLRWSHLLFVLSSLMGFAMGLFADNLWEWSNTTTASTVALADSGVQPQKAPSLPTSMVAGETVRHDVDITGDPFLGPAQAPVTIVEFSDYQCPYCQRFKDETLAQLLVAYPEQVRFVYRDFPLARIHSHAQKAAEAAECAHEQGQFWEMHDSLFAEQRIWSSTTDSGTIFTALSAQLQLDVEQFQSCLESGKFSDEVENDYQNGLSYGVSGTPTFFINGRMLAGAVPFSVFKEVIESELSNPN